MEDRRNLFVIIFITFFVMVYVQWMFPSAPVPTAPTSQIVNSPNPASQINVPSNSSAPSYVEDKLQRPPSKEELNNSPQIVINTGITLVTINLLGARIQSLELRNHKKNLTDTIPYQMIADKEGVSLPLKLIAENYSDDFTLYSLKTENLSAKPEPHFEVKDKELSLEFEGQLPSGVIVVKKFTFYRNSYAFDFSVNLDKPTKDGLPISILWSHPMTAQSLEQEGHARRFSILTTEQKLKGDFFYAVKPDPPVTKLAHWIGISDFYFLDALISKDNPISVQDFKVGEDFFMKAFGTSKDLSLTLYSGPKEIETLRSIGHSLDRSVDLGWFSFLAHPILSILRFFYSLIGNYGISIILLTLLIKLGFLPLTQASFKSMKAMQELQPEVAALRERVKDPNVLNQELMMLYKKRGVNPLGGCLPIFIQIPVFLGLYNALLNSIELRHEPFALWIKDLSSPERLEIFGVGVPLMILLMGASMFWQQKTTPSTLDPQQQKILLFMPLIFTVMFIIHPMPSGLVLYWLVNNIISIVQQIFIKGHKSQVTPLMATAYASFGILIFGYILTLI